MIDQIALTSVAMLIAPGAIATVVARTMGFGWLVSTTIGAGTVVAISEWKKNAKDELA